jgi:hypothetical protein
MMSSDRLNIRHIRAHWDGIVRLASSIKQGTAGVGLVLQRAQALEVAWAI